MILKNTHLFNNVESSPRMTHKERTPLMIIRHMRPNRRFAFRDLRASPGLHMSIRFLTFPSIRRVLIRNDSIVRRSRSLISQILSSHNRDPLPTSLNTTRNRAPPIGPSSTDYKKIKHSLRRTLQVRAQHVYHVRDRRKELTYIRPGTVEKRVSSPIIRSRM